ncbi:MAG: diversity-generating retroelement protein Avd [Candidatus ainarchaeum sp.]|nr:diversity-generating retroelement protein Avd [Candidatus ainarchaeum sp.]MDD3975737.1 diversity-generating retroelement protein Avd [Candidatus ainarchaeum sp.]
MLSDLKLYNETYNLILWLYPIFKKYPKSDKYSLGKKQKDILLEVMSDIILFSKNNNLDYLKKIDLNLELLRISFRLSKDLKIINFNKYEIISKKITSLGSLVGGLIKKYL